MNLSRAFVGFSGTDLQYYRTLQMWKANNKIDFNFADCQLEQSLRSLDENYIKRKCREKINHAGTFIQLIGEDTKHKHKYVRWEAEVALEKGCRIIGVNIDGSRRQTSLCPPIIDDVGAIFVSLSPKIIQHALDNYSGKHSDGNYYYKDSIYNSLGI